MRLKILFSLFLISISNFLLGQDISSYKNDSTLVNIDYKKIENPERLNPFFTKLKAINKEPISIVHIGDSHVQGPYFPNTIREQLQSEFGNAGRGFVFPYRVAKTNGAIDVKFKAAGKWNAIRNVKSDGTEAIGLSGIYLETKEKDFIIQLTLNKNISVDSIQIIAKNAELFKISTSKEENVLKNTNVNKFYTIKSGDYLSKIAKKFSVTVKSIKQLNKMKTSSIYAGKQIKIPTSKKILKALKTAHFTDLIYNKFTKNYSVPQGVTQLYIRPKKIAKEYILDGLILKNKTSGILYNAIGVNGAKFSDYNKSTRFFNQLKNLKPDLIIISLGTNESFYQPFKITNFKEAMSTFKALLLKNDITASVLATCPPPSLVDQKKTNNKATLISNEIAEFSKLNNWAYFNMHYLCGTSNAMKNWELKKLASKDKIHFTQEGYMLQAEFLVETLIEQYKKFEK